MLNLRIAPLALWLLAITGGCAAAIPTAAAQDGAYGSPWPATELEQRLPRQFEGASFMIQSIDFAKVPKSEDIKSIFASAEYLGPWLERNGRSWKDVRSVTAISDFSKTPSATVTLYQVVGATPDSLMGYLRSMEGWFRTQPERVTVAGRVVERAIDVGGGSAMYAWAEGDTLYTIPSVAPAELGEKLIATLVSLNQSESPGKR